MPPRELSQAVAARQEAVWRSCMEAVLASPTDGVPGHTLAGDLSASDAEALCLLKAVHRSVGGPDHTTHALASDEVSALRCTHWGMASSSYLPVLRALPADSSRCCCARPVQYVRMQLAGRWSSSQGNRTGAGVR